MPDFTKMSESDLLWEVHTRSNGLVGFEDTDRAYVVRAIPYKYGPLVELLSRRSRCGCWLCRWFR